MSTDTPRSAPPPSPVKLKSGRTRWRVRYKLQPGTNSVMDTFDTYEEAQRFSEVVAIAGGQAARDARDAAADPDIRTLICAYEDYQSKTASHASPRTVRDYERYWDRYLQQWAHLPVEALSRTMIQNWVTDLRRRETSQSETARATAKKRGKPLPPKKTLSGKTIANIYSYLSAILTNEVLNERLSTNRALRIKLPDASRVKQPVFLTQTEFNLFLGHVDPQWQGLVSVFAATGMRYSEATALKPTDFLLDSDQPLVRVTKAWKDQGGGRMEIGPPKTRRGTRSVSLPASLVPDLRALIEDADDDEFLFRGPNGGLLTNSYATERILRPAIKSSGVRTFGWHDLRHSHASWLIMMGVPLTVIQYRLGHSSIRVTSDVYGHLQPDAWQVAADAVDTVLEGAFLDEVPGVPLIEA